MSGDGRTALAGSREDRLLDRVWERLLWYWERAGSERIRRRPGRALDRIGRARSLLVVCQGNIIRSPFAAHRLADAVSGRPDVRIASAGLTAVAGRPAHPLAVERGRSASLRLDEHAATPVTAALLDQADVVLVMEVAHLVRIRRRFARHRAKTLLLTCATPETAADVRDPDGCEPAAFEACFDHIDLALQPLVRALRDGRKDADPGQPSPRPVPA